MKLCFKSSGTQLQKYISFWEMETAMNWVRSIRIFHFEEREKNSMLESRAHVDTGRKNRLSDVFLATPERKNSLEKLWSEKKKFRLSSLSERENDIERARFTTTGKRFRTTREPMINDDTSSWWYDRKIWRRISNARPWKTNLRFEDQKNNKR